METTIVDAVLRITDRLGFPVAVTVWFMWMARSYMLRLNGKLETFGNLMNESTSVLKQLVQLLHEHDKRAQDVIRTIDRIGQR